MKKPTKDLFDDTTMTFGEHLEILRIHLIKAMIGLAITVTLCLYQGTVIVDIIRRPIDRALDQYSHLNDTHELKPGWARFVESIKMAAQGVDDKDAAPAPEDSSEIKEVEAVAPAAVTVQIKLDDLAAALHSVDPDRFPAPPMPPAVASPESPAPVPRMISLTLSAPEFEQFRTAVKLLHEPVTLTVQEAFMIYMKVSMIAGVVLASPWIFFQIWQFVAAGLYHHERKYVYIYGTLSLVLFLVGIVFCYFAVFPFVLNFLLGMNAQLDIHPQIRMSEWINFAVILPLAFGISFQLPLVMLFLERISVFETTQYRQQRRLAILVIAILSALLTPAEPMSMLMMMFPLIFLYELGILLCQYLPQPTPFDAATA